MIDVHVTWKKLEGKPNASMLETKGSGFLSRLEVGRSMFISGDYGVSTSVVEDIEVIGDGVILVKTKNSIYLVEAV